MIRVHRVSECASETWPDVLPPSPRPSLSLSCSVNGTGPRHLLMRPISQQPRRKRGKRESSSLPDGKQVQGADLFVKKGRRKNATKHSHCLPQSESPTNLKMHLLVLFPIPCIPRAVTAPTPLVTVRYHGGMFRCACRLL